MTVPLMPINFYWNTICGHTKIFCTIDLCPECPAFYDNRSACHLMLSQFTQALADAKCSLELDPIFVQGYVRVSKCYVALGDVTSAQHAIDKALKIEPNNVGALQEQSSIQQLMYYVANYKLASQEKDYRKVYIVNPNKVFILAY